MRKTTILAALVPVVLILLSLPAFSQVANTPFKQFVGTYTPLPSPVSMGAPTSYDDGYYNFTLPFPFKFNGVLWNSCGVGTNGYITFGLLTTTLGNIISTNYAYPAGGGAIAFFSTDMYLRGPLEYQVFGNAPNRHIVFQYNDWYRYGNSAGTNCDCQVKLYETTGMIEFVYSGWTTNNNYSGAVGLRGQVTTDYTVRTTNGTVNPWASSVAGTTNTAVCSWQPAFVPPDGLTYRWGCNIPDGSASIEMVDASGAQVPYYMVPGPVYVKYMVNYPPTETYTVNFTLNFYRVGDASGIPLYTESFDVVKPVGTLEGIHEANVPQLPEGFYVVEAVINMWNNCNDYEITKQKASTAFINPGSVLCEVWPGDTDIDHRVTYGDKKALNKYIADANMNQDWIYGPARYRSDGATNPMSYLKWEAQAGIPWKTPEGCHMDTDGNGVINTFDYIAMKVNWMKSHSEAPSKSSPQSLTPSSFDMSQNYPNPFNATTKIEFSAPERSAVTLVVTDMLGRTVATLVDGEVQSGVHSVDFDAKGLTSGQYIAIVNMAGAESGLTFSKTIRLSLNK